MYDHLIIALFPFGTLIEICDLTELCTINDMTEMTDSIDLDSHYFSIISCIIDAWLRHE